LDKNGIKPILSVALVQATLLIAALQALHTWCFLALILKLSAPWFWTLIFTPQFFGLILKMLYIIPDKHSNLFIFFTKGILPGQEIYFMLQQASKNKRIIRKPLLLSAYNNPKAPSYKYCFMVKEDPTNAYATFCYGAIDRSILSPAYLAQISKNCYNMTQKCFIIFSNVCLPGRH
jgi:hypothetical protein